MDDSDSDSANNNILNRDELMGMVSTNVVLAVPFVVLFYQLKRRRQ